jgi:hypothetical protein
LRFQKSAPGGLNFWKVREASLAQLTRPLPVQNWHLNLSKRFYQEPWTWARSDFFIKPVEADRPRSSNNKRDHIEFQPFR